MFNEVRYDIENWEFTIANSSLKLDEGEGECIYEALRCPIWPHDARPIVDSTGAGDSFIGGFITGLLHGLCERESLKLASIVASQNLRGAGARTQLPTSKVVAEVLKSCPPF